MFVCVHVCVGMYGYAQRWEVGVFRLTTLNQVLQGSAYVRKPNSLAQYAIPLQHAILMSERAHN